MSGTPRWWRWYFVVGILLVGTVVSAAYVGWQRKQTRSLWQKVEAALEQHDLDTAARYLDAYLGQNPTEAEAWFLAARTARRLGQYARAEELLTRCQQLTGVTDSTRLEWQLLRVQQGDLGDVHLQLRASIPPDHPDVAIVLEALARGYLASDRLRDVVKACELWISVQPNHPWPYLWRGSIYERLGNFHESLAQYRRAQQLAPNDPAIRLAVGLLLLRGRQPAAAIEYFQAVLEQNPEDKEALLGLAQCRLEQGQPKEAIPLLDQLLRRDPSFARAWFHRGKAAFDLGDAGDGERCLRRAVQLAPDDAEAWHQLTLTLRALGKEAEAEQLLPRLQALRKDLERLNVLIRAVARTPEDPNLRHEAGVLCLKIGRSDEGVRWLLGVLRLPGEHRETHAVLAEHFQKLSDPRAEEHRRRATTKP